MHFPTRFRARKILLLGVRDSPIDLTYGSAMGHEAKPMRTKNILWQISVLFQGSIHHHPRKINPWTKWSISIFLTNILRNPFIFFLPLLMPSLFVCSVMSDSLRLHELQPPLSVGLSRQWYWNGLPFHPPGDVPNPGIEPMSPVAPILAGGLLSTSHLGSPAFFLHPPSNLL